MSRKSATARQLAPEPQVPSGPSLSVVPSNFEALQRLATLATEFTAACDAAKAAAEAADVTGAVTAPASGNDNRKETKMDPTAAPQGNNVPTFESLLAVATELGEQAGKGKDTQIKFDLKVIEAAYLGALSLDPNKHGPGRRDGIVLAEAYVKAQGTATTFDAKADKSRKLISNLDKCIKLGSNPKWGPNQPLSNVNELITHRQTLRKNPAHAKKLDDAHNALMRYATAQLKSDVLIDGDALKAFAFKKEAEEVTVEEVLEGIRKRANALKAGKVAHCHGVDSSPEVQAIINACTKRLAAIAKARGGQQPGGAQAAA